MHEQAGVIGGLLQEAVVSMLPEEEQQKYHRPPSIPVSAAQQKELEELAQTRRHPVRHTDATDAVIAQLQGSLHRYRHGAADPPKSDP